jgi:CDP-glucose 4,6-dehydratase
VEDLEMTNAVVTGSNFWQGKRVLLTGHTGFKGAWLALWLQRLGAQVTGISLAPATTPNLFDLAGIGITTDSHFCDIRNAEALRELIDNAQPEIVFHLAAQALVRTSYCDPLTTFSTNIQGTANVLDAMRYNDSVRAAVMITTDKVYQNLEQPYPYRETDVLGGHDPYSASKAAAEIVIASFRDAYLKEKNIAVATARAGNVIGGGDWSEDRLIPDAVKAWQAGYVLEIRRPQAVRPWQHVLEPLAGYLTLARKLWQQPELAGAYNFGPQTYEAATVRQVVELARTTYTDGDVKYGDGSAGPHEAGWLALEVAKARTSLGVASCWSLNESVQRTMHWYRKQHDGIDARVACDADIVAYEMANQIGT